MGRSRYYKCATLSEQHGWGNYATVSCNLCRTKRHYLPADLIVLMGDLQIDRVEHRMKCEDCGRKDYVHVRFWKPITADEHPKVIRRLERIETVHRPIWRDERP